MGGNIYICKYLCKYKESGKLKEREGHALMSCAYTHKA